MYKFILILLTLLPVHLYASEPDSVIIEPRYDIMNELRKSERNGGEVKVKGDVHINNLLKLYVHQNEKNKSFTGFRIQIYSASSYGSNVEELKVMRNKFEQTFQDIPAYLKYFDPDFKIRVGNFHSRLECIPVLHRIRKLYPSSYPVKTDITLDELKRVPMQDVPEAELQEQIRF